jgi:hypothetical protein
MIANIYDNSNGHLRLQVVVAMPNIKDTIVVRSVKLLQATKTPIRHIDKLGNIGTVNVKAQS